MGAIQMLNLGITLQHYKRKDVQDAILEAANDKEITAVFGENGFGKRPDIVQYGSDILEQVKQGATSFHCSEENWYNVLRLGTDLKRNEMDDLRKSWDLVIDIDCKILDYSKIAGDLIIKALKHHNIRAISCKFSGNHGFHIAIPAESFPEKIFNQETRLLFPEAPRKIAFYLQYMIKEHLAKRILEFNDINEIMRLTGKKFEELIFKDKFDPFTVLQIDTILISSRHLFRMPYSFNEKSGLVSIPVDPDKLLEFKKEEAAPSKVVVNNDMRFLDRSKAIRNEAKDLIVQAFDFDVKEDSMLKDTVERQKSADKKDKGFEEITQAIPVDFFPPCIKNALNGLKDGKKRALLVLINYLSSVGWSYEQIDDVLKKWNKLNEKEYEALRDAYIDSQLRYHKLQKKKILPPNCSNKNYYMDINICKPDGLCARIKNPVQYAKRRVYMFNLDQKKPKRKAKEAGKTPGNENKKQDNSKTPKKA